MKGIGVIGAGNMGAALVRGFVASGKAMSADIRVYDSDKDKVTHLRQELGIVSADSIAQAVSADTEIVVIAVKPQIMADVLKAMASQISDRPILVSIAAGVSTKSILSHLSPAARVIRVMPNAAAMVSAGAAALCKAGAADEKDLKLVMDLFCSVGEAVAVDEKLMNVVTALSGSGPGYLFPMMEALTDGAVRMGLDRPTARALTVQTFLGAATMAASGEPFSELKDRITSPGGTTIAGLQVMERAGLRGTLMDVIQEATERAEELDQS